MFLRQILRSFSLALIVLALLTVVAVAQGTLPVADDPAVSGSFVYRLYKAGHLMPAIIVGLFFLLKLGEKKVAWLRTGYRKLYVAVALAGLGELAERVADGTTPNLGMIAGTIGVAFTMWMKTHGEAPALPATEAPKA